MPFREKGGLIFVEALLSARYFIISYHRISTALKGRYHSHFIDDNKAHNDNITQAKNSLFPLHPMQSRASGTLRNKEQSKS